MQFFYQRMIQLVTPLILRLILGLILSLALAACGGGERELRSREAAETPGSATQEVSAANEAGATVNVVAQDFEFLVDSSTADSGTVTFVVTNEGSMPHDFAITIDGERHQTAMLNPGASALLTVDLQPGSYEYICTVPGHDILGMKGTFTVN